MCQGSDAYGSGIGTGVAASQFGISITVIDNIAISGGKITAICEAAFPYGSGMGHGGSLPGSGKWVSEIRNYTVCGGDLIAERREHSASASEPQF
jgi:hypothetical protein